VRIFLSQNVLRRPVAALAIGLAALLAGCHGRLGAPDVKVKLVMKKYEFVPPVVRVKQGQVVELDIETADVQHGLAVPDLGIKEPVRKGQVTTVLFRADKKGEYPMACYIICGPGHDDMAGKIVVE
jgi:cytochrome c oxidase subunit II